MEQILRRHPFQHNSGCDVEGHSVGQFHDLRSGHDPHFRIGSRRQRSIGGPIPNTQVFNALANRVNNARGFHAQGMRHF